jgi:hypothetical protein
MLKLPTHSGFHDLFLNYCFTCCFILNKSLRHFLEFPDRDGQGRDGQGRDGQGRDGQDIFMCPHMLKHLKKIIPS